VKARIAKDRRPQFPREVLELFAALENVSERRRDRDQLKRLHRLLGLSAALWGGNSVLDRSSQPGWLPGRPGYDNWFHVHAVRKQLLAALEDARPRVQ
jgi:hypothetical protein